MNTPATIPSAGARGPRQDRAPAETLQQLLATAHQLGAEISTVTAARDELVEQRRRVILDLHAGGLSVRAIATALAIAPRTVQTALHATPRHARA